jgi:hypothetical protein
VNGRPTPSEIRGIGRVAAAAELEQVELLELNARRIPVPGTHDQAELDVKVRGHHVLDDVRRSLTIHLTVSLATAPPIVDITMVFLLRYSLSTSVTDADAKAFGQYNALFNLWPYLRETVHSLSQRMGLPPLVLPLHKSSTP